jgi:hypothetical protein
MILGESIPKVVIKYLKRYLNKSQDTKEDLFNDSQGVIYAIGDDGWVEYTVVGDIFWINTMYYDFKDFKTSNQVWSDLKKLAKLNHCTKIQFTTKRNGKIWERRFKDMKVIQWKIEVTL